MPYSEQHKQQSRNKILKSARKLFARKGFEKVSIDDLMADAGMTRGAFYAHFSSKSELYAEAVLWAAFNSKILSVSFDDGWQEWFKQVINGYLHRDHVDQKIAPCPLAFLATDVANEDRHVRSAYTKAYNGLVDVIDNRVNGASTQLKDDAIYAITAMMIGGVAISRAVNDKVTVEKLLESCRNVACQLVEKNSR